MRGPEKVNALALASVAALFYLLALTPIGVRWQPIADVRDVYLWAAMFATVLTFVLRRAEHRRISSLDRWMAAVWVMAGFAIVGLSPVWPVLFLAVLFGSIVRLEAVMAFQRSEELAEAVGIR